MVIRSPISDESISFRRSQTLSDAQKDRALENIAPGYSASGEMSARAGFFKDDDPTTRVHRLRDRVLFGDGALHTGRRTAPLGGSWLTEQGANYFEKNAHVSVLTAEEGGRIALLAGSYVAAGDASAVSIGIAGVSVNDGEASYSRAIYAEAMHKGNAASTGGIEVQVGNYTSADPSPTSYSLGDGAYGLSVGAESGAGYTVGDDSTAIAAPTLPAAAGIVLGSGSLAASYQRFKVGMVFTANSLYRETGGTSGVASAIMLAQQHEIEWRVSDAESGATIRSDVSSASSEVGLIFKNNTINFTSQSTEQLIFSATHVASAVNYVDLKPSATGLAPQRQALGSDTNVGIWDITKGNGQHRFLSHGGTGINLYIVPPASSPR